LLSSHFQVKFFYGILIMFRQTNVKEQNAQPIDYIFDTDIGNDFDDTGALILAMHSHSKPLAVTTVHTEPMKKAKIAKLVMSECGFTSIPVYAGIGCTRQDPKEKFLQQNPFFPARFGFPNPDQGEKKWHDKQAQAYEGEYGQEFDKMKIEKESASEFIAKIAKKYSSSNKLTIVAIGPLHNISAALELDPSIANNIKLVSMGGLHPKGYNWLISPQVSEKVLSKVETVVITSDLIAKNNFFISAEELAKIIEKTHSKFGKTVIKDWKNWHQADYFGKSNTNLYDPVTLFLALHPEYISATESMRVQFPCLMNGKVQPKFMNRPYFDPELKGTIISATEDKQSQIRFVTKVNSPEYIRTNVVSAITGRLTQMPKPLLHQRFSNRKIGLCIGIAAVGIGLFARRMLSQPVGKLSATPVAKL